MVVGPHVLLLHVPVGELLLAGGGVAILLFPVPGGELVGVVGGEGPLVKSELIFISLISGSGDLFS